MIAEGSALWKLFRKFGLRQYHYCKAFKTPDGEAVLLDLAKFCFARAPTTNEREVGRREVWLRIQQQLELRDEELTVLMARLTPEQRFQVYYPSDTFMEGER